MNCIEFKVGESYYLCKGAKKPAKIHIRSIVDNEYIVYKWYGTHRQRWTYQIEHKMVLTGGIEGTKTYMEKQK
jgi:hypothetical protein